MSYSVPVPGNYREIDDRFTSTIMGAPDFERLQRAATYTITLEMMIGSLLAGLDESMHRSKSEAAKDLYERAIAVVRAGHQDYSNGREAEGQQQLMLAHNIFRSATNKGPRWNL